MRITVKLVQSLFIVAVVSVLSACAPDVGSPDWCKAIETKPKGEMTMNEAKDYAKHCVFK